MTMRKSVVAAVSVGRDRDEFRTRLICIGGRCGRTEIQEVRSTRDRRLLLRVASHSGARAACRGRLAAPIELNTASAAHASC